MTESARAGHNDYLYKLTKATGQMSYLTAWFGITQHRHAILQIKHAGFCNPTPVRKHAALAEARLPCSV